MRTRDLLFPIMMAFPLMLSAQGEQAVNNPDPREKEDGSWIALTGAVKSTGHEQFTLDHGDGTIEVKLERKDLDGTEHKFIDGERVTVYGIVDDGFFASTQILARAVFVESLSTFVHKTEGSSDIIEVFTPVMPAGIVVQGRVTEVNEESIVIDEGDRKITIDTDELDENMSGAAPGSMGNNKMDDDHAAEHSMDKEDKANNSMDKGMGQDKAMDKNINSQLKKANVKNLKEGDTVIAVGNTSRELFSGQTLKATSLYTLDRNADEGTIKAGSQTESDR